MTNTSEKKRVIQTIYILIVYALKTFLFILFWFIY